MEPVDMPEGADPADYQLPQSQVAEESWSNEEIYVDSLASEEDARQAEVQHG